LIRLFICVLFVVTAGAYGDDWCGWLGAERDAVWREEGIVRSFPEGGPKVRWRTKISSGYAGPAVSEGRVYVTDRVAKSGNPATEQVDHYARRRGPGIERVLCLRESDGAILWKHEYDCPYSVAYPAGPRATPTVYGGKVYTLGSEGNLFCLDAATGSVVWSCDFKKAYGLKVPVWGICGHPLVDGDRLICIVGGEGTTAIAFDKDTGREIWRALSSKSPGYSAPVIYAVGGVRQLIIWHGESINGLDPETGEVYWSVPIETWSGMAIATPRLSGDRLFVMGFQRRSTMIRVGSSGREAEVVWREGDDRGVAGAIDTPFIEDGYIYGSGHDGLYRCVKLDTGERVWGTYAPTTKVRENRWANAFTVKNGDCFFLANDRGELIIAKLTPDGYEELSRCQMLEATGRAEGRALVWSHPAFANKCVYARNDKEIVCISLAKR
jgi:outer membrane protein assembly factor BamB